MSLQRRLILFFVVIVVIPLAAAGFVVQRLVVGEISQRSALALTPALDAATLAFNERASVLEELVDSAVDPGELARAMDSGDRARFDTLLGNAVGSTTHLDFLVAADARSRVVGHAATPGDFLPGFRPPREEDLLEAGPVGRGFAKVEVPLVSEGRDSGRLIGGFWLDGDFLVRSSDADIHLSVVAGRQVIASTAPVSHAMRIDAPLRGEAFETELDGSVTAEVRPLGPGRTSILASTPTSPADSLSTRVIGSIIGLLLLALIGTTVLATVLARLITRPLDELAQAADAVSQGRFDHRIPVRSRDEVGRLAVAFNEMTERLRETITELQDSRDLLQRAVRRVGNTLRSTHDLTQMLEAIVDTATDAVGADAAVLWRFTSSRTELYPALTRGLEDDEVTALPVGDGVAGLVAERATTVMIPSDRQTVRPARGEPPYPVVAAVPLYTKDRVTGVVSVHRRDAAAPFTAEDLEAVVFLAEQGSVAVENVMLHEEAQRLSLTDGLTGVYNRRYFQMQFRQLLATAVRFERPFSMLMIDLDHFKRVNDTHGHQRGDAILIEFSKRVAGVLREVDTFARYGGEEFIALLSETPREGAESTAHKILEVVRAEPFRSPGEVAIDLTCSVGIACYPEHGDSFAALVEAADQALYAAKQEGRDRAVTAGAPPSGLRLA
ncbi:MAG TPA: diguanylate cyclase [Actinomycetota bacterium]|jgi:two-component system, cell cycle response regulator|nr:diguanylate cyclase [Actinomycetota bacterium]